MGAYIAAQSPGENSMEEEMRRLLQISGYLKPWKVSHPFP